MPQGTYLFLLPWSLHHLGGVNQVVMNLAHEMKRSGSFKPLVLISDWSAVDPIFEEIQGLQTIRWRIRAYRYDMGIKERIAFLFWKMRFRRKFESFCKSHQVAAINPHYPGDSAHALRCVIDTFEKPVPLVLSFHGTDVTDLKKEPSPVISRWRHLFDNCHAVVACSNDLGQRLNDVFGHALTPHIVHNGLDTPKFIALADVSEKPERPYILSVGKFELQKGQDVLIDAFTLIANDYPDIDLVLIGATDKALIPLRELCKCKGIEDRVFFLPNTPHSKVAKYFKHATIFALPSKQEAFPLVILEAGAFGLPVAASRVGGIPEILTDGVTGRLFESGNVAELALCLRSMLDSPSAAPDMGKRLQRRVVHDFTWTSAHDKYVALVKPKN